LIIGYVTYSSPSIASLGSFLFQLPVSIPLIYPPLSLSFFPQRLMLLINPISFLLWFHCLFLVLIFLFQTSNMFSSNFLYYEMNIHNACACAGFVNRWVLLKGYFLYENIIFTYFLYGMSSLHWNWSFFWLFIYLFCNMVGFTFVIWNDIYFHSWPHSFCLYSLFMV